jgi:hypothetical protein
MKRVLVVATVLMVVTVFAGVALAQGPHGPRMGAGWGAPMGPGLHWGRMGMMQGRMMGGPMMGGGMMGGGMMGGGPEACPMFGAMGGAVGSSGAPEAITEEKAKEIAAAYTDKYFAGFTVERVLPFEGRFATAYQVELKGPKGERRMLRVNPWGNVRPFGQLAAAE